MNKESLQTEFLSLVMNNKDYNSAQARLKASGSDFTIYSCTEDIIKKVVETPDGDEFNNLVDLINESNRNEIPIADLSKRKSRKKVNAKEMFFNAIDDNKNKERLFILLGETGVGKSYLVEERYPNIPQYACNKGLDPYSLCYHMDDKGDGLKPYETPFLKAVKEGGKVFLDEMNELPHDTLMLIQGITDEKKSMVVGNETISIHEDFKIIAAMNPPSETDERIPLGDALLSRSVGWVLELTDDIIMDRLKVKKQWLTSVRKLFNYVRQSGMLDVRPLSYRDYDRLSKYDFATQFKFKVCMGDISNIRLYETLTETGEFDQMLQEVLDNE